MISFDLLIFNEVTRNELLERLDSPMEPGMVQILTGIADAKYSSEHPESYFTVNEVMDLTFHPKKEVVYRAAWLMEYIFVNHEGMGDYLDDFLKRLNLVKNDSAMRHYSKIIAFITGKKATGLHTGQLDNIDFEPVIDILFSWLIDDQVLVASKAHSMQALANLAPRYKWIKEELLQTIDHLQDLESIAFFARAKQIRKALKKV